MYYYGENRSDLPVFLKIKRLLLIVIKPQIIF